MITTTTAFLAVVVAWSQPPLSLDASFQSTISKKNVNAVLPLPDGDVILSGRIYFPGDQPWDEKAGVRLNANGSRDLSFTPYPLMGGKIEAWDGKMYVGNGSGLRRLFLDGSLDTTFNILDDYPLFSTGQGGDFHIYPDGRALFTGSHSVQDTAHGLTGTNFSLVWFTNTGDLDTTQHHRQSNNAIYTLAVQPDSMLLVSGIYSTYEGQPAPCVLRLHADGERDTTFTAPFVWGMATDFTPLTGGRVLASGYFLEDGSSDTLQVVRFMSDGSLDPTFNLTLNAPRDLFGAYGNLWHTLLPDGRIALHGNFSTVDGQQRSGIALLDSNGFLSNAAFTGDGCGAYNDGFYPVHSTHGMIPDQNGNWYIYGTYIGYDDGTTNDPQQRFISRLYGLNVGLPQMEKPLELAVFPNPTNGEVQIRLPEVEQGASLHVIDPQGRVVLEVEMTGNMHVLDLGGQAAGLYAVRVRSRQGRIGKAIVVVEN
jgi:uncharacterized delta-60 repeat protein